ncbi:hypothetical protein [Pseudomonas putida]|uniref:Uncharacterized protein n=1 Tax=Pseudomonas putida TaxID=303 RepID=A0A8I1JIZ3_PSEPU|nr:hypothetical protein [Pseudomonas putida]MBI6883074.1 hypothetical protein [Pseudomonas putida]
MMNEAQATEWIASLKPGDKIGVYSGSQLVMETSVDRKTSSGRVVCQTGAVFLPNGEIFGKFSDKSRRIRPLVA